MVEQFCLPHCGNMHTHCRRTCKHTSGWANKRANGSTYGTRWEWCAQCTLHTAHCTHIHTHANIAGQAGHLQQLREQLQNYRNNDNVRTFAFISAWWKCEKDFPFDRSTKRVGIYRNNNVIYECERRVHTTITINWLVSVARFDLVLFPAISHPSRISFRLFAAYNLII